MLHKISRNPKWHTNAFLTQTNHFESSWAFVWLIREKKTIWSGPYSGRGHQAWPVCVNVAHRRCCHTGVRCAWPCQRALPERQFGAQVQLQLWTKPSHHLQTKRKLIAFLSSVPCSCLQWLCWLPENNKSYICVRLLLKAALELEWIEFEAFRQPVGIICKECVMVNTQSLINAACAFILQLLNLFTATEVQGLRYFQVWII